MEVLFRAQWYPGSKSWYSSIFSVDYMELGSWIWSADQEYQCLYQEKAIEVWRV